MNAPSITIKSLYKSYQQDHFILRNLSLQVDAGEIIALTGKNGVGKTTLLRILATLIGPTQGTIHINGLSLVKHQHQIRKQIGYLGAGEQGLHHKLTGRQNLHYFASLYGISSSQISQQINWWSNNPLFLHALGTPFHLCSTGMKYSLRLFASIIHNPKILLLDEPFDCFDQENKQFIIDKVKEFATNRIVIFSTHSQQEITQLATKCAIIEGGEIASLH